MGDENRELLQGTLDLLLLRALSLEPLHGYGTLRRLAQMTGGTFRFQSGSVFPALYRLERDGFLASSWGETENRRRARYYRLTRRGERRLVEEEKSWRAASLAITRALEAT